MRKLLHAVLPGVFEESLDINELAPINIEQRIAIDQRGCLGSIYDGYTDNIRGKLKVNITSQSQQLRDRTKCVYIQDWKHDAQNLLKFVDINHQLRLGILLQMTPTTGIASLVHHPRLIDTNTRLLYFYHASHKVFP